MGVVLIATFSSLSGFNTPETVVRRRLWYLHRRCHADSPFGADMKTTTAVAREPHILVLSPGLKRTALAPPFHLYSIFYRPLSLRPLLWHRARCVMARSQSKVHSGVIEPTNACLL